MPYSQLQAGSIRQTLDRLSKRIAERFPERGLARLAAELLQTFDQHMQRLREIERPHRGLRLLVAIVLFAGLVAAGFGIVQKVRMLVTSPGEIYSFEGIEAIANILLLMGGGIWFLLNLETRRKREQALDGLHQLRSMAHIIDMHQLTKDPATLASAPPTSSSPVRDLSPAELLRYLDYCAELLSMTGKIAALYMQRMRDPVVIEAANDVEALASGFSNKIWQKITIVEAEIRRSDAAASVHTPQIKTASGDPT